MSLPAILLSGYLALGLLVAFLMVLGSKKKSAFGLSEEPALFWLYLFLWPVMALVWLASPKKRKEEVSSSGYIDRSLTRSKKEPNQSPQRNAGSRPSTDDSSASETPSSLGPRG